MKAQTRSKPAPKAQRPASARVQDLSHTVRQALFDALLQASPADDDQPALTVERAARPIAPERLARHQPGGAAARAEAQALYERCLAHYREAVRPQDAARGVDDVGAAVALFVAANLQALHGEAVTPAMLLTLEQQLGGRLQRSPGWRGAPARERQAYFEQVALLGVLVHESHRQALEQGPAAIANLRGAAYGYLQQMLGVNPLWLMLDAQGLHLRRACACAIESAAR